MSRQIQSASGHTDAATKGTALVVAALAAFYGIAIAIIATFAVVNTIVADAVTVPQPVSVDIATEAVEAVQLVEGTFRMADITVTGIAGGVRALLASSTALDAITHLSVALGIVMLCIALVRGRPFMPAMVRTLILLAFALVISGMLSSALLGFANMEIANALDQPGFPMAANLDFTATIVGVVLALVASAFKIGERLQRDTDGLV